MLISFQKKILTVNEYWFFPLIFRKRWLSNANIYEPAFDAVPPNIPIKNTEDTTLKVHHLNRLHAT